MFGLFALTNNRSGAYLDILALGDFAHCETMRKFFIADGDRRVMQVNAILRGLPMFQGDAFQIVPIAIGSLAHCNEAVVAAFHGSVPGVTETVRPRDTDVRVLARVVDLKYKDDPIAPGDVSMGTLGVNRTVWRGVIPEARFSHKVRLESESKRKAVPVHA